MPPVWDSLKIINLDFLTVLMVIFNNKKNNKRTYFFIIIIMKIFIIVMINPDDRSSELQHQQLVHLTLICFSGGLL